MPFIQQRVAASKQVMCLDQFFIVGRYGLEDRKVFVSSSFDDPVDFANSLANALVANPSFIPHVGAAVNAAVRLQKIKSNQA